jgi:large subunit ribosomal protein L5
MTTHTTEREMPRLKARYRSELEQGLKDELALGNIMQVPRPLKVVVNMGIGEAIRESRLLDGAVRDLTQITGQKPLVTKAKKSIAGFKIREGQSIGAKVTLRGDRMWEFLDRLISGTFDGHGNFTFGLTEQLVFPEIDYDKIEKVRGMDITVVTSAETDDQGRALLTALGFPFRSV